MRSAITGGEASLPVEPTADPDWLLIEEGFNLAREHEIESLFTVANGYVGTRGSLAERTSLSAPATFVAGVFDARPDPDSVPGLAVAPDWTHLQIVLNGRELKIEDGELLDHRRVLDLYQGILWRDWVHRDPAGRVARLRFLRLASLADRHALLQVVLLTPENFSGQIELEGSVGPQVEASLPGAGPSLVAPPATVLLADGSRPRPVPVVALRTRTTGVGVAFALASRLLEEEGGRLDPVVEVAEGRLVERTSWMAEIDRTYRLDRLVVVYSSRETERPEAAAASHLERLTNAGVERVIAEHVRAWQARWAEADVAVEGDVAAQRALRFAVYHLVSAANPEDERVSVGARALTGAAYLGHVFWDTEIYLLPFYTLTDPPTARALLMYRYHTLPGARANARRLGYRGALYAWESTDTGEDTTPRIARAPTGEVIRILTGEQEHHISADVAYAVWQYWQASGDEAFFRDAGGEVLLETARFWASRGQVESDGRYHIRKVIGPDEYHEGVDDNAYTNGMARWNLERGAETAAILAERWPERWRELSERLQLGPDEPQRWLELAGAMATGFDPETGLFEQFAGYFDLEEIDLDAHANCTVPIDVCLGRERVRRSKVNKQADVVALLALLWDSFPPEVRRANFRYYEPRTAHGSSLSPSFHALVAARLGEVALAERYFRQGAEIDLGNNMGNAAGGVHIGALGGLWQAAVLGFGGLRLRPDGLVLDPHLPSNWTGLRFRVHWRGRRLDVALGAEPPRVELRVEGEEAVPVALGDGPAVALVPGQTYLARRRDAGWEPWRPATAERDDPEGRGRDS